MKRHDDNSRPRVPKKLSALITSIVCVAAALFYIVTGGNIGDFLEKNGIDINDLWKNTATVTDGELEVHVIDIGQGDSILVRWNGGNMLIDAGPNSGEDALRAHLDACGVKKLDYLVCTHPHEDHIGGADMVVKNYEIGKILMPVTSVSTATVNRLLDAIEEKDVPVEAPAPGDVYTLGDVSFEILGPDPSVEDDANNSSIVLRLRFGDTYFMFTGDAEKESEAKILESFPESDLKSDFLKVGHHGSSTSTSEAFLAAVSPEYAAISCEKGNSYGHPHRETIAVLKKYGITGDRLLRTDISGTIVVVSDGQTLSVGSSGN